MQNQQLLPVVTAFTLPNTSILPNPLTQYLYPSTANTDLVIYPPIYSKEAATIAKIYTDD